MEQLCEQTHISLSGPIINSFMLRLQVFRTALDTNGEVVMSIKSSK